MDVAGNVYVADRDNHKIRKVRPGGIVTIGERPVAPRAVDGNSEQLRAVAAELVEDLVVQSHLIAAHRAPVGRVERQDDGFAPEVGQLDLLVRRRVQLEFGSQRTRGER